MISLNIFLYSFCDNGPKSDAAVWLRTFLVVVFNDVVHLHVLRCSLDDLLYWYPAIWQVSLTKSQSLSEF